MGDVKIDKWSPHPDAAAADPNRGQGSIDRDPAAVAGLNAGEWSTHIRMVMISVIPIGPVPVPAPAIRVVDR